MIRWIVAVVLTGLVWSWDAGAHEGHVHRVMGTVALIDATHVEIDTTEGKHESYPITEQTRFLRGGTPAALADVERGVRVVITVVESEGRRIVSELKMAGSDPPGTGEERHH